MADNKADQTAQDMGNYASKHPRRMYGGMLMLGTAIGATMMAAKKNRDKNALQKFMDQISHK
jgi:hypothetical protein